MLNLKVSNLICSRELPKPDILHFYCLWGCLNLCSESLEILPIIVEADAHCSRKGPSVIWSAGSQPCNTSLRADGFNGSCSSGQSLKLMWTTPKCILEWCALGICSGLLKRQPWQHTQQQIQPQIIWVITRYECVELWTEECQCSDYSERLNPLILPAVLVLLKSPGLCHVADEIIIMIENRYGRDLKKIPNSKQK